MFTDVAKLIASDSSGQAIRNYRKPQAEQAFAALSVNALLDDATLAEKRATIRQQSLASVPKLSLRDSSPFEGESVDSIGSLVSEFEVKTTSICMETSDSVAIQRLQDNADIAEWIEMGLSLHHKHSSEKCEYCQQSLPKQRLEELAKHFNQSDRLLKGKIELIMKSGTSIHNMLSGVDFPAESRLYQELQPSYKKALEELAQSTKVLIDHIASIGNILADKLKSRTEGVATDIAAFEMSQLSERVGNVNSIIDSHNKKSAEFEEYETEAREAIENHHISGIREDVDKVDGNIKEIASRLVIIDKGDPDLMIPGIEELEVRISANKKKVSNTAKAAIELTDKIQTFLGRDDLSFEPEGEGYRVVRGGKAALGLSEGEKTAITFIYFVVQLRDQDFDLATGIVAIDDPISSLDSNSVYQAFSFLKNAVKDASQIFMFTHNFDFLKLLINWAKRIRKKEGEAKYFMLLCDSDAAGNRQAGLKPMDKELYQNESEYTFLFKQLYNFKSDGTIWGSYHVPNMARKVLEAFLDFYHPGHGSLHAKLGKIPFDENKKTALLKFSNDLSHPTGKGFDPALVPETQTNVRYLLEMIQAVSPVHYSSIEASIKAA